MKATIAVIGGDGIGPEIVDAAQQVMEAVADKLAITLVFQACLAGGAALDACGVPLPQETVESCRQADAVLLGAVGDPKWDAVEPARRPEKAILGLRQALGLFINLRPIKVFPALVGRSPLKEAVVSGTDLLIVRELNGGIYYGERQEADPADDQASAYDIERYSAPEIKRIVEFAFKAAQGRRGKLTSVDKANVLATSRLWRGIVNRLAGDYADVEVDHLYVDNGAMQLVLQPSRFDVVVTSNLFGDILSDEAAVTTGSIGLLPSASLGDGTGLYEPIHGSAPDIAGQGKANPIGTILSAAMLFRYSLKREDAAQLIEAAVERVLAQGVRTADIAESGETAISTKKMGELVIGAIKEG